MTAARLHDGTRSRLHVIDEDGRRAVLKDSLEDDARQLLNEHRISLLVHDIRGVRRVLELRRTPKRTSLLLQHVAGPRLKEWMADGAFDLRARCLLAVRIAEILRGVHRRGVVHRDVNTSNILVEEGTERPWLIDFGIAFQEEDPAQPHPSPHRLLGSLPFIAPEQTGRLDRRVDHRADLYSFGVVLYELFTGHRPFDSSDPLELVHEHIAKAAPSPLEYAPDRPPVLSEIVLKLLAKDPDQRYQSAAGLQADLARCLRNLDGRGRIAPFAIGQRDAPGRLVLPQRLYGREREVALLRCELETIREPPARLVLIAGPAGVGKTALVRSLRRQARETGTRFVEGNFDQYHRLEPYAGLSRAFRELVALMLADSEERFRRWQTSLLEGLGTSGAVLTELFPALEKIIGVQAPAPDLGGTEARNRLEFVLRQFLAATVGPDEPLVLFLDDLQWSDESTMRFVERSLATASHPGLLVVGAYRDDEVDEDHPLQRTHRELERAGVPIRTVTLRSLAPEVVRELVVEGLAQPERGGELADFLHERTDGNPLFLHSLLQELYGGGQIRFDAGRGGWDWDLAALKATAGVDDVREHFADRLSRLGPDEREVLRSAACAGTRFTPEAIAAGSGKDVGHVTALLGSLLGDHVVVPRNGDYQFAHDRVRQAVYEQMSVEERAVIHLRLGRWLATLPEANTGERIFEVVGQLDRGLSVLQDAAEREQIARLNLAAARRAHQTLAHDAMEQFLDAGLRALRDAAAAPDHDLTLALLRERARCLFLRDRRDAAEDAMAEALAHCSSEIERARVTELRLVHLAAGAAYLEAIEEARRVLASLDSALPSPSSPEAVARYLAEDGARLEARLRATPTEDLLALPRCEEPGHVLVSSILSTLCDCAVVGAPEYLRVLTTAMLERTLRLGCTPFAPFAFICHAMVLSGEHDYERAHELGELALTMNRDRFRNPALTGKLHNMYGGFLHHLRHPFGERWAICTRGYRAGLESGDLVYAAYNVVNRSRGKLFAGASLGEVERALDEDIGLCEELRAPPMRDLIRLFRGFARCLQRPDGGGFSLDHDGFREADYLATYGAVPVLAHHLAAYRLRAACLLGDYDAAAALTRDIDLATLDLQVEAEHVRFFGGLSLLRQSGGADATAQETIASFHEGIERLAASSSISFRSHARLLSAERHRTAGRGREAMRGYDEAVAAARASGLIHDEALACELAAQFHREQGFEATGRLLLDRALLLYGQWGATRKVDQLGKEFPFLVLRRAGGTVDTSTTESETLELASILKASHALAFETEPTKLLERMLAVVMESSGADRALVLLRADGRWRLVARGTLGEERFELGIDAPWELSGERAGDHELCGPAAAHAARTREGLVVEDALADARFRGSPYVQRSRLRSLLCLPLVAQDELSGLLYLENRKVPGVFWAGRLELLRTLSAQMAISLENARVYREIQQSEARHRRLIEALEREYIVFVRDAEGSFSYLSPSVADVLGCTRDAFLTTFTALTTDDPLVEAARRNADRHARRGRQTVYEVELRHESGEPRLLEVVEVPVVDDDGRTFAVEGLARDVTERKRAELELRQHRDHLEELVAARTSELEEAYGALRESERRLRDSQRRAEMGQWELDLGTDEVIWSEHMFRIFELDASRGAPSDEAVLAIVHPDDRDAVRAAHAASLSSSEPYELTHRLLMPDGRIKYVKAICRIEIGAAGAPARVVGTVQDITPLKNAEEALRVAKEAAEAANRAKSTFLASMSHEIRTPMNAILGYAQLMQHDAGLSAEQRRSVEAIGRSGDHLLTMLDGVLEMSKIEAGRVRLLAEPFDLASLLDDLQAMLRVPADAKGLKLSVRPSADVPRVVGDLGKVRQILINLIGNAIKFTDAGEVVLQVGCVGIADEVDLAFVVSDTGRGIDAVDQRRIFEGFEQTEAGRLMGGGTGLGLAIAREHARLMGGDITVESESGYGSSFRFTCRVRPDESREAALPDAERRALRLTAGQGERRVLVADDSAANRDLLATMLGRRGFTVREAAHGGEAIDVFASWSPHLVLIDLVMPVMDGPEAIRGIRALEAARAAAGPPVPIIAVSANVLREARELASSAGADGFISKPFREADLLERIREAIGVIYEYERSDDPESSREAEDRGRPGPGDEPVPS